MRAVVGLGALLVSGTAVLGYFQMDRISPKVAGFMAVVTGAETNPNVRRPDPNFRYAGLSGAEKRNRPAKQQVQAKREKPVVDKGAMLDPVKIIKKSPAETKKHQLIAALGGKKEALPPSVKAKMPTTIKPAEKAPEIKIEKAERKLLETIRKKAVTAASKIVVLQKPVPQIKKNLAYENNKQRPQPTSLKRNLAKDRLAAQALPKEIKKTRSMVKPLKQVALLTKRERRDLGKLVEDKKLPAIDLVIEFDYKSAILSDKAIPQLTRIGEALTDGKLADATFVIAGHTDAVGGNPYNMGLSAERAQSVQTYLRDHFNISAKRLVTVGYGEERLKNPQNPNGAVNRRVEFINLVR